MSTFTARQGEYLAFIHRYTVRNGCAPSFEEIARHFGTSAPSVNGMVKTLESRGLLDRVPGAARSLRVLVPPSELPGSDFGGKTSRAAASAVVSRRPAVSAADCAAAAATAVLDALMPRLAASAPQQAPGDVERAARSVFDALGSTGLDEGSAREVFARVVAQCARWMPDGRGIVIPHRVWVKK